MHHNEAEIIINGVKLSKAESFTLRNAVTSFHCDMIPGHLGNDAHGLKMVELYSLNCKSILNKIFGDLS